MAEGCNLYKTEKDLKQIVESLTERRITDSNDIVQQTIEIFQKEIPTKFIPALQDSRHPAHKIFSAYILRNAVGNDSIPSSYKEELPKAVADLIKITPKIVGLITPANIRGQTTPLDSTGKLGHKTRGAGFAYQILGAAALLNNGSKAINTGRTLKITQNDKAIGFECKFPAHYSNADDVLPQQPKRKTTEADLFIDRGAEGTLGVDFKHSMNSGQYSGVISTTEIEGRKIALQLRNVDEFHYVTNGTFSKTVKDAIDDANRDLSQLGVGKNLISIHEGVRYGSM